MPEQVTFKCLRCGNEWRGVFDTDLERMCPKCRSNSVRRIKDKETRRAGGLHLSKTPTVGRMRAFRPPWTLNDSSDDCD